MSGADITYELPLHRDSATRCVALFMGDMPAYAGPIRSARVPLGSLREMWDCAWVFYGWQNSPNTYKPDYYLVDVDGWAKRIHADARRNDRWAFPFVDGLERNNDTLFSPVNGRHSRQAGQLANRSEGCTVSLYEAERAAPLPLYRYGA